MTEVNLQNDSTTPDSLAEIEVIEARPESICLQEQADFTIDETTVEANSLIARTTRKTLKYLAITAFSASVVFTAQNPRDVFTMIPGLFAGGDMAIPEVEGCKTYVEPVPEVIIASPTTKPGSASNTESTVPETAAPPTADPEDEQANQSQSAASKISWRAFTPFNLFNAAVEYDGYFDNLVATHTSSLSGIEYQFYAVGDGKPPNFNFESLEKIESAAFDENLVYQSVRKQHAIDCMRTALFGDSEQPGKFEGRIMPIVVPTEPACVRDLRIRYDNDCAQTGYKMPRADLDFLIWDLNPNFDEFMLLTTGGAQDKETPYMSSSAIAHELWHMLQEWVQGAGYEFELNPEERMAEAISLKILSHEVLSCVTPPVYYQSEEDMSKAINNSEACNNRRAASLFTLAANG